VVCSSDFFPGSVFNLGVDGQPILAQSQPQRLVFILPPMAPFWGILLAILAGALAGALCINSAILLVKWNTDEL
jgi:ABC-type uncharacterized transport system permease subunit